MSKGESRGTTIFGLLALMAVIGASGADAAEAAKGAAAGTDAAAAPVTFDDLTGEVVLDNARVLVQKFVIPPGRSTGRHWHPADQLLVFIKGGTLKAHADGRAVVWHDGRVWWQPADAAPDDGSTNAGTAPIELVCVTLKPVAAAPQPAAERLAGARGAEPKYRYLNYPNIPGEDVLENDFVIVQRFLVQPGQWEGVHAHHPDMLYIHVKGGQWAERTKDTPPHPYPEASPDGEVGWMATIPLSVGHQSGNVGKTPIDLIWVTLKK
ncbi:MAG TPA: hypothetical protein VHZ53_09895 [Steroidobacteraceae bacterium]|jgi:quercetin dioxygenase-like cupin family protein|nr:hypothetical protein [Steroidobacteraceae bacterium]